jgi:eukaryotic translation initiation factor 2C
MEENVNVMLCWLFVMAVPPAYYAQKLTQRARVCLAQGSDTASASSSGSAAAPAPGGGSKQLPVIKDELKRSVFYC